MTSKLYTWTINSMLIVSILAPIAASVSCYAPTRPRHSNQWESRAKATLRAFGETELAYQNTNNDRDWGTFENLVDTDYIARGYTRGNIIENYSVWMRAYNPPYEGDSWFGDNTFTIVAFPRVTRPPGYLHTFAIREDQVLRVYDPTYPGVNAWGMNDDWGAMTWEPVK